MSRRGYAQNLSTIGRRCSDATRIQSFPNDFPALLTNSEEITESHSLLRAEPVTGACDVIVYNPQHDLLMARMSKDQIRAVIAEWRTLYDTRGHQSDIGHVQIFEVRLTPRSMRLMSC